MTAKHLTPKKDISGVIHKLSGKLRPNQTIEYALPINDTQIFLNDAIGRYVKLTYQKEIFCIYCHKKTKKSFSQGYCFSCFRKLARCDLCIMKPELCHYHSGTCREPEWGESFCMIDHVVYIANTSDLKVGITRKTQIPTRWIDQGATQALPIFRVSTRQLSGFVEDILRKKMSDRTNWRNMLKGAGTPMELHSIRDEILSYFKKDIDSLQSNYGLNNIQPLHDEKIVELSYPVKVYPTKIQSFNFDKTDTVSGRLQGIKGQYLILDTGVINIRKFTGYNISLHIE